jgi:Trypsin
MRHQTQLVVLFATLFTAACAGADSTPENVSITADDDAIVGGVATGAYGFVVAVGDTKGSYCTGTVISKGRSITRIRFGERSASPTATRGVVKVLRHPGYDAKSYANDVALVELASDAPSQAAPLLRATLENTNEWVGPDFTFVGYGVTNGTTDKGAGTRRVVKFPIGGVGPLDETAQAPGVDATQFYYNTPGKSTCVGDSGGPGFIPIAGVHSIAGVTSYGDDVCKEYGVQQRTDTPMIDAFIQPFIDKVESANQCKADGACEESCNTGGQVKDPDCHADHCGADGICARACVTDPDCK